MRWWLAGLYACCAVGVFAQTDETIYREFQFDFATPGARANAMGRAFVGLADEATAAYNNPAGLAVLASPEFSLEYRSSDVQFAFLQADDSFALIDGEADKSGGSNRKLAFASFSFSAGPNTFSAFYVNHLDYQRATSGAEQTRWLNLERGYEFTYVNEHDVHMEVDTFGLSGSRRWGRLSLGAAIGVSVLRVDYRYSTRLSSDFFSPQLNEVVESQAAERSARPTFVVGGLFEVTPKVNLGLVFKKQPQFKYDEKVNNPQFPPDEFPEGRDFAIRFKVPDSVNLGLSYQPNDLMTILLDFDWIRYDQLTGEGFTIISGERFSESDYQSPDVIETHFGAEYLIPLKRSILALRSGVFLDPDHKTRFVGPKNDEVAEIQDFIFNFGDRNDNVGFTAGIGFVWRNKVQLDIAAVRSDRFDWLVTSLLYRF